MTSSTPNKAQAEQLPEYRTLALDVETLAPKLVQCFVNGIVSSGSLSIWISSIQRSPQRPSVVSQLPAFCQGSDAAPPAKTGRDVCPRREVR
jgi:hypothetical protein